MVLINIFVQLSFLLVLAHILLSYFMSPYHPVRQFIDRLVNPFLAPIRRILPQTGALDFSPLVLVILIQVVGRILIGLLQSLSF
jgi:YggT family protein